MRTTLVLDDDLVARATALTGLRETSALVNKALSVLIERESARRLACLGASQKRPDRAAASATAMQLSSWPPTRPMSAVDCP